MANVLICEGPSCVQSEHAFDHVIFWSSFEEGERACSAPLVVDRKYEQYRHRYLAWLADLGNLDVNSIRLVEHFRVRPDFSIWWMSLLAEKSQWKSSSLYEAFRLLAVDDILNECNLSARDHVTIVVSSKPVQRSLIALCRNVGVGCVAQSPGSTSRRFSIRPQFKLLPYTLQAMVYLVYALWQRRSAFRPADFPRIAEGTSQISFFTYFFNFDLSEIMRGRFRSRYWGPLYDQLQQKHRRNNWFHLFTKSKEISTPSEALSFIDRLNLATPCTEWHELLDRRIDFRLLLSVIHDFAIIWLVARRVGHVRSNGFRVGGGPVDLWPIIAHDWHDSFFGKTAIINVIYLNLIEATLRSLPTQSTGFYLLEGQGWERALIHAWRDAGHGRLIGVQHATVSDCDLRHFFSPAEYKKRSKFPLPMPDFVAINGDLAKRKYLTAGFPENQLIPLEGLRYLYLGKLNKLRCKQVEEVGPRLLVLGDYLPQVTRKQMGLLAEAAPMLPATMKIMVKAHPACPIKSEDWPSLDLTIMDSPLDQLVGHFDVAFTSNMTSASVDAYLMGKRVVSILDPGTFNMSPLRGCSGVEFVATSEALANALSGAVLPSISSFRIDPERFFYTESELPRWRRLLSFDGYEQ